jgi:hypothetical protein
VRREEGQTGGAVGGVRLQVVGISHGHGRERVRREPRAGGGTGRLASGDRWGLEGGKGPNESSTGQYKAGECRGRGGRAGWELPHPGAKEVRKVVEGGMGEGRAG